jgi:hypothetical protein
VLASCENLSSPDTTEKTPTTPTTPETPSTPETPETPETPIIPAQPAPKPAFGGFYRVNDKKVASYWQDGVRYSLGETITGTSSAVARTASAAGVTYVAGIYQSGTTGDGEVIYQPCYWANGTLVTLKDTDGQTAFSNGGETTGIAISNGTVYTAGSSGRGEPMTAGYWSGTSFHALALPKDVSYAYTMSIAASASGDVFIAGYYYDGNDKTTPCYWKNGAIQSLSPLSGAIAAYVYSIALSGDDVYLCGISWMAGEEDTDGGLSRPCYWKNNECFALDGPNADKSFPGETQYARSICVANGVVYTAGYYRTDDYSVPCYWEETTLHALTGGPVTDVYLSAIAVSDGVVSVAGYYKMQPIKARASISRIRIPCYWEGGTFHDLVTDTPEGEIPYPEYMSN